MEYKTSIKVRYNETDQMAVVYHANYFAWFDIGRTGFFGDLGQPYAELEEKGVLLPVIEANCKYIKPAKYADEIIIITKLAKLKGVRLKFEYALYRKEDNTLIAEGYTTHAFVDKNMIPINFKKKYSGIWELLEQRCLDNV